MTKKFFAILLALVLTFAMSTVAFASGNTDYSSNYDQTVTINKTYTATNGTAPSTSFTFKFEAVSAEDPDGNTISNIPSIANVTTTASRESQTVTVPIDADDYDLGVYTYKVTEVVPTTKISGIDYSEEELYLVLTIVRDENSEQHYIAALHYEDATTGSKTDNDITNTYDSGTLSVTKQITGNMANMSDTFKFTVTFSAATGEEIVNEIGVTIAGVAGVETTEEVVGNYTKSGNTYTFYLGDDQTAAFTNVPANVTYTVSEEAGLYDSDGGVYSDPDKKISGGDTDTVTFTNDKSDNNIDTGITMDSMPYIVLLALAVVGLAAVTMKKRYEA